METRAHVWEPLIAQRTNVHLDIDALDSAHLHWIYDPAAVGFDTGALASGRWASPAAILGARSQSHEGPCQPRGQQSLKGSLGMWQSPRRRGPVANGAMYFSEIGCARLEICYFKIGPFQTRILTI